MLFLLLAMLSSAAVSVVMRLGTSDGQAHRPMLTANYVVCFGLSFLFLRPDAGPEGRTYASLLGLFGGALYLGAFLLFQKNVRENGVTLSSAFMKLGVVVPTVLGFTLFHEPVGVARALGMTLTVAAILVLSGKPEAGDFKRSGVGGLILLLLCGGLADGLSKFHNAYGSAAHEGRFLLFVFGSAMVLSIAYTYLLRRDRPSRRDILFGLALGLPNFFSSKFLLAALNQVPASAAYPAFSCGTILLTSLAGRVLFHEKISRRQCLALALVLAALALLNL